MTQNQNSTEDVIERPRLLLVAGPNGSGKTTVTERGLAHIWFQGCEYVNPDFIARDTFGDWNSPDAIVKAANCALIAKEIDRLYLYDNSVEGEEPKLVIRACNGVVVRQYSDARPWMLPILENLEFQQ